jgi:uracil-DNA glycosylase
MVCGPDSEHPVRSLFAVLARGSLRSVDREAQLALCSAEVLLRLGAVAHHVVVTGCTCTLHLVERFDDMHVHSVKVMPVVD